MAPSNRSFKSRYDPVAAARYDRLPRLTKPHHPPPATRHLHPQVLLQLGGIPVPGKSRWPQTKVMWLLWMLCVFTQWFATLLSLICLVLAYVALEHRYHHCMLAQGGTWAFFNVILPSVLIHPALVSRQMAMM